MTLQAKLTGGASFEMGSTDAKVPTIITDAKAQGVPVRSLFSALPRGGFRYVPLDLVVTSAEVRAVVAFFDAEAAANGET